MTDAVQDEDGYADFSDKRKPVRFAAQGERYDCHEALSIGTAQKVGHISDGLEEGDVLGQLRGFFALVMDESSRDRIMTQLTEQGPASLTITQGVDIMHYVMERYGLRPTQPSSD